MLRALTLGLLLAGCNGDKTTVTGDTSTTTAPSEITDSFTQTLITPIDILWVVDRSWTDGMSALDQETLNDEFELLLLADPSWKIGVLDSTADGSNFGIIAPQFSSWPGPDPFGSKAPASSSKVREAIHLALELRRDNQSNKDFIRSDAGLYVIVYTDKDDSSENPGTGTGITSQISQNDFDNWFNGFEPSNSKRLSVITTSDGKAYWKKHLLGGGILYDVGSFRKAIQTVLLDAIGQKTVFTLSQYPADPPATVRVTYREHGTDYDIDKDYSYDPVANTIAFKDVIPQINATITVTYLPTDAPPLTTTSSTGG